MANLSNLRQAFFAAQTALNRANRAYSENPSDSTRDELFACLNRHLLAVNSLRDAHEAHTSTVALLSK